ncbi:MAG: hypothetical protein AAF512_02030 [Pseudomonadota bacterium]
MADQKLSELTARSTAAGTDELHVVAGGANYRMLFSVLLTYISNAISIPVSTVFGRTGAVTAQNSDYDASQIDNDSSVSGSMVSDALNTLDSSKAATSHNHDSDYADISHNHDSDYAGISHAHAFNDLSDVSLTGAADNQMLARISGSWVHRTASQMRTLLGLVVGTDVQAYDADIVAKDVANDFTKPQSCAGGALTDAATIAWDMSDIQKARVTLGGNRTLGAPTNVRANTDWSLRIEQGAGGNHTLAYNSIFKHPGGTAPVLSTTAGDVDILCFQTFDSTSEIFVTIAKDFS